VRFLTDEQVDISDSRRTSFPEFPSRAPSSAERDLRRTICDFVQRAYRQRLFIITQGSLSARVSSDSFLITPVRLDRGAVEMCDLVLIDGGRVESGGEPSRAAAIHDAIYRAHPEIGCIINAFPVNATAFSVTGAVVDTRTIPESYVVVRRPAMAPYGIQFENPDELARMLSPLQPTLILENDGVLVTGKDVLEAFDRLEVIESTAEAFINSRALGSLSPMSDEVIRELDEVFLGL